MREFAKSSMLGLILRHLKSEVPHLLPDNLVRADEIRTVYVPAPLKREALEMVYSAGGPTALFSIGQGLKGGNFDPIWRAALSSGTVPILLEKWLRFEAYAHSHNRLLIEQVSDTQAVFHRYSLDGGSPTPAENLLICGVLVALLEAIGCVGLRCWLHGKSGAQKLIRDNGVSLPIDDASLKLTDDWTICWTAFVPEVAASSALSDIPKIPEHHLVDPVTGHRIQLMIKLLSQDVSRVWKVSELARQAAMSTRGLQRTLAQAQLTFSSLVRMMRVHEATRLLKEDDVPLTAIAFCAGFSDSAHFSRDFRASTGLAPREFRKLLVHNE